MSSDDGSQTLARLERRLAREKKARREAESIAEKSTRDLYEYVQRLERQNRELEEVRTRLLDLSMPVLHLWERVVAVPVIGNFDGRRAEMLSQTLLSELARSAVDDVILDIKGIATVDTTAAQHLLQIARSAELMGARTYVSGLRPEIALTAATLGFEWGGITVCGSLRDAFRRVLAARA